MNKIPAVFLAALVFLSFAVATGFADEGFLPDPDDSGTARVWDIEKIAHSHAVFGSSTSLLRHTIDFYDDVSSSDFSQGFGFNGSGINLLFETADEEGPERIIYFVKNPDGSLAAAMRNKSGQILGFGNFFQPASDQLVVEFPRRMFRHRGHYRWTVTAISRGGCNPPSPGGPPEESCADTTGELEH